MRLLLRCGLIKVKPTRVTAVRGVGQGAIRHNFPVAGVLNDGETDEE
jgi:hypothetical protein